MGVEGAEDEGRGNCVHPGNGAVKTGSCLKDSIWKCWNLLEIPCQRKSLKYPHCLLKKFPVLESLYSIPADWQPCCSWEPGDIELIKCEHVGFGHFHCMKCPFIKLESEVTSPPYIVLVMSLDDVGNYCHDPSSWSLFRWGRVVGTSLAQASGCRLSKHTSASHTMIAPPDLHLWAVSLSFTQQAGTLPSVTKSQY